MSANLFQVVAAGCKAVATTAKDNMSTILITGAAIGVGFTAYFAIKETPAVNEKLEKAKEEKGEELDILEKAKIVIPGYAKTETTAVVTIGAMAVAHKADLNKIAAYSAAAGLANDKLTALNAKLEEELGEKKSRKIHDSVNEDYIQDHPPVEAHIINTGKGLSLCLDNLTGVYFYSDKMAIERAADKIKVVIAEQGYASKNDWLAFNNLDYVVDGDYTGWNKSNCPFSIQFTSCITSDGRPCLVIDHSDSLPTPQYESWY